MNGETLDGFCHVLDENIDEYIDYDDVDLSSFRPMDELCPFIWNGHKIKSDVRNALLEIADDFIDFISVDWAKPIDIILTGSLANYNWSKYSDFDIHILLDFKDVDDRVEFVKEYFDSKKNEWNNQHENLKIKDFPVELYVQDVNEEHTASGVYSLEDNEWLEIPEKDNIKSIKLNKFYIKEKAVSFANKIDSLGEKIHSSSDPDVQKESCEKIESLFDKLKGLRKDSLDKYGEMGSGNIIYKTLRRMGYLDKILELKSLSYDKMMSR